jgi:hypothetical protein
MVAIPSLCLPVWARRRSRVDFGGDDATAAAELTGDEDRSAGAQLFGMTTDNVLWHLNLATRRFQSLLRVLRIGSGEGHQQQRHGVPVAAFVSLRVGREDSTEK